MFCLIIMKFCQNISYVDVSDEFENGRDQWKNMAAREWGSFLYMYIVTTCEQSRRHIFFPIFMKFGHILEELKNGSGLLKNMAAKGPFVVHSSWNLVRTFVPLIFWAANNRSFVFISGEQLWAFQALLFLLCLLCNWYSFNQIFTKLPENVVQIR